MQAEIVNPRRAPRVPLRASVEIRHHLFRWMGETEDLGPGGCQIVSPRPLDRGRDVKLTLRVERLGRTVTASGRVAWSRAESPTRLGVAFERSRSDKGWFEALLRSDPEAERAARSVPERIARDRHVYLGKPPSQLQHFSPLELELLRRVGGGLTLDALARSFGPDLHERTRGALFGLLARRLLVFDAAASDGVARWRAIFHDPEDDEPAPGGGGDGFSAGALRAGAEAPAHLIRWA